GTLWMIPAGQPSAARSFALEITATAGPTPLASGVLVASVSGEVLLVDRGSGTTAWRVQLDGPIEQPPLVRDRQLVVIGGRGAGQRITASGSPPASPWPSRRWARTSTTTPTGSSAGCSTCAAPTAPPACSARTAATRTPPPSGCTNRRSTTTAGPTCACSRAR